MIYSKETYTSQELAEMLGTTSTRGIRKKLSRYGITYSFSGKGENALFYIHKMENPFKVFCITELNASANCDFDKMLIYYHYFLNDENFATKTALEKEEILQYEGKNVSRQTIASYEEKLHQANLFYRDTTDCVYYFAYKKQRSYTDQETYKQAWSEYFAHRSEGWDWYDSIMDMVMKYGGVARKQPRMIENVLSAQKIEELNTLINIQITARLEEKKAEQLTQ